MASRSGGRQVALRVGDRVSVAVKAFGEAYAKERAGRRWQNTDNRDTGVVKGKDEAGDWVVDFLDDEEAKGWKRKMLRFESREETPARPGATRATAVDRTGGDSSADEGAAAEDGGAALDSSDEDEGVGEPVHDGADVEPVAASEDWTRDDLYGVDERAKKGVHDKSTPRFTFAYEYGEWNKSSLFEFGKRFLPMNFLTAMATLMTAIAKSKYDEDIAKGRKNTNYKMTVSVGDILQWIGVWIYMLSFPMPGGTRRDYFTTPSGGYGPELNLKNILRLGDNGEKSINWFEAMQTLFKLPSWEKKAPPGDLGTENNEEVKRSAPFSHDDPFKPTRRWWDALRTAFRTVIQSSWLLCLDESMVRWEGRGMPGLMVILRKPTPVGLELHTLCCALCGVLIWFEVYEGKLAMWKKMSTATPTQRASR